MGRLPVIVLVLGMLVGCGSLTSKENAGLISEFDDILDYDRPPVLVKAVRPEYPDIVRDVGAEGRVVIKALVLEDGTIGAVQILESPNDILANQAITALRLSEFTPALRDGRPCSATTIVPFVFDKGKAGVGGRTPATFDEVDVRSYKSTIDEISKKK